MTPYQRGCRDMLLKLEKEFLEAAEIAQLLSKTKDGGLRVAPQARAFAYSMAAVRAKKLSEALPEEPSLSEEPERIKAKPPEFQISETGLYVVKLFDSARWSSLHSKPFREADAIEYWLSKTHNGTHNTKVEDGCYYAIFPAPEKE